jgi:hypothetical protein
LGVLSTDFLPEATTDSRGANFGAIDSVAVFFEGCVFVGVGFSSGFDFDFGVVVEVVGLVVVVPRGFATRGELRLICGGVVRCGREFFDAVSVADCVLFSFLLCAGVVVTMQRQIIETKIVREILSILSCKLLFVMFTSIRVKGFNLIAYCKYSTAFKKQRNRST